jgi:hypothetical protein
MMELHHRTKAMVIRLGSPIIVWRRANGMMSMRPTAGGQPFIVIGTFGRNPYIDHERKDGC